MLESGTQNLVRIFTHEESSQETPYAAVFNPTPTSTTSGGFFHMFGISGGHLASQSSIDCPSSTSHCTLQDFMVVGSTLYALWDKLGQSSIEKIALDVNHTRAGAVEGGVWQVASYASEPELTPAYLNQLLLEPGSMTDHLLSSILRPGSFSPLTLRTAIAQYTDACLSLPGTPAIQLRSSYSTINEKIAAVVGCTVKLARDPQTGAVEHDKYAQALKRDWEGFIARCREIERSARRPLAISVVGRDDVILVERERVGTAAGEDFTLQLQRCLHEGVPVNGPYALCEILWKLRAQLGVAVLAEMETATRDLVRQEIAFPYSDLLADQAQRIEFRQQLDPGFASWLDGRIAGVKDMDAAVRSVLDLLGGFDKSVKREEDEVALLLPLSNTEWTHGLAFSYAAATIESRYELTLALLAILFFLAEDLHQWQPSLLAEVLSIFRGISMLRLIARQPGAGPSQSTSHHHNADDISSRLQGMAVSGNGRQPGTPFVPTYALMHQLFAQGLVGVEPAAAAHQFMDNSGMLQSGSPAHATRLEVLFCERLRLLGYHYVAQELLSWLPKAPAASYVLARSWLDIGRADDAAHLIELVAGSFGIPLLPYNSSLCSLIFVIYRGGHHAYSGRGRRTGSCHA
jgi:nuclear pore complex protein Nup160